MSRWGIEGGRGKKEAAAPTAPAPKVFTGGDQGFVSLKLDAVEIINHNTKKFRFAFDDPESVSGLTIACKIAGIQLDASCLLTPDSRAFDQVQGTRNGEACHASLHSY
jgi:hypothetical protein